MQTIKTGESFAHGDYKVTRLGASAEDSQSDWALLCIASGDCNTCDAEGGTCPAKNSADDCGCDKNHVHAWVKSGHCFSAGDKACRVTDSNREQTSLEECDGKECGLSDC